MNRELKLSPSQSGLSYAVGRLQEHFYNHATWVEKVFGLAADEYKKNQEKLTLVVPQAYDSGKYVDVLPNNKWVSHAFFYADGAEVVEENNPFSKSKMSCPISLVVWVDLDKVKKEMGYDFTHRYIDELIENARTVLNQFGLFKIETIDRKPKEVWKNWTIGRGIGYFGDVGEYADTQVGKHPEAGFRIKGTLYYRNECKGIEIPLPPSSETGGNATVIIDGTPYVVVAGTTMEINIGNTYVENDYIEVTYNI